MFYNVPTMSPFSPGAPQSPLSPWKTKHKIIEPLTWLKLAADAECHPPYCPYILVAPVEKWNHPFQFRFDLMGDWWFCGVKEFVNLPPDRHFQVGHSSQAPPGQKYKITPGECGETRQ